MRTTLSIDDDVLIAARAISQFEGKSLGEVISSLARKALPQPSPRGTRNNVPLLPVKSAQAPVTLDIVNALRDDTL